MQKKKFTQTKILTKSPLPQIVRVNVIALYNHKLFKLFGAEE